MYGFNDNYSKSELFDGKIDIEYCTFDNYIAEDKIEVFSTDNVKQGFCFLDITIDISEYGKLDDIRKIKLIISGVYGETEHELNTVIKYSNTGYNTIDGDFTYFSIRVPFLVNESFEKLNISFYSNYDAPEITFKYMSIFSI